MTPHNVAKSILKSGYVTEQWGKMNKLYFFLKNTLELQEKQCLYSTTMHLFVNFGLADAHSLVLQ